MLEEQQYQAQLAARQRKQRMQSMDRERQKKLPPTEYQRDQTQKEQGLLSKAKQMLDEEHDDVKHMNQMVLYSKVVTIRDRQLEESKRLEQEWLEEQKRLDLMMEIERLKSLKVQEERESRRKDLQRHGAAVIVDQIREREIERVKEQEMREREMLQMMRQIEQLKEEEYRSAVAKKERAKVTMLEVEESNKRAIEAKEMKRLQERDLDQKILDYNLSKA